MGFRTKAESLSELFARSAIALTNILVTTRDGGDSAFAFDDETVQKIEVNLSGPDLDELMFAWLSEILYQFDGERNIFCNCESIEVEESSEEFSLNAILLVIEFKPEVHQVKTYVKAITFHQMNIVNEHDEFSAQVYVDI